MEGIFVPPAPVITICVHCASNTSPSTALAERSYTTQKKFVSGDNKIFPKIGEERFVAEPNSWLVLKTEIPSPFPLVETKTPALEFNELVITNYKV